MKVHDCVCMRVQRISREVMAMIISCIIPVPTSDSKEMLHCMESDYIVSSYYRLLCCTIVHIDSHRYQEYTLAAMHMYTCRCHALSLAMDVHTL